VVADTGPVNDLILIGHVDPLHRLFGRVVLPAPVHTELSNSLAPAPVQLWIASPPTWLEVIEAPGIVSLPGLHKGEAAAIALGQSLTADLLLMGECRGVRVAQRQGLRVTGTLGVLDLAAARGLVDFAQAIRALDETSFRKPTALLEMLLAKHGKTGPA